jgi:hypothetical protein
MKDIHKWVVYIPIIGTFEFFNTLKHDTKLPVDNAVLVIWVMMINLHTIIFIKMFTKILDNI